MNKKLLYIEKEVTISSALKQMDEIGKKLLIVVEDNKFHSLLSIGDIQRAIIHNKPLSSEVSTILRKNVQVLTDKHSFDDVRHDMLHFRIECMPIIDAKKNIVEVYFWEDIFGEKNRIDTKPLNLPVVIMAGGKGSRLKPITNVIPKPLIPIGDKTILENIMDRFVAVGCNNFHVSVNYRAETIEHYFDTFKHNYKISYFTENKPLGTAGSLYLLKNKIHTTFFVSNCDILIEQDYHELYNYHKENKNDITLVAALKHYRIPYGTILSGEDGILEEMSEKPELTFKINVGLYVLEPHLLNKIPQDIFFHITELIEQIKNSGGRVGVFPVSENSWVDIGEWPEYIKTVRSISNDDGHFQGL